MSILFDILTGIFDLLLYPFRLLPPVVGIIPVAVLTALFALWIYKSVSNQDAISRGKKRIMGHFLGIYLFRDDLGRILRELGRVFTSIGGYLRYVLPPLVVIVVPVLLVCAQLQVRYGYRPLQEGEEVNLYVELAPEIRVGEAGVKLETGEGTEIVTPPLRIEELNEVDWKIMVREEGIHEITISAEDSSLTLKLDAGGAVSRIYPLIGRESVSALLTRPGAVNLSQDGPFLQVRIDYPVREYNIPGIKLHWSIVFFILVIAFGFALRRPLGVDF